jgi:hypothetical protein
VAVGVVSIGRVVGGPTKNPPPIFRILLGIVEGVLDLMTRGVGEGQVREGVAARASELLGALLPRLLLFCGSIGLPLGGTLGTCEELVVLERVTLAVGVTPVGRAVEDALGGKLGRRFGGAAPSLYVPAVA